MVLLIALFRQSTPLSIQTLEVRLGFPRKGRAECLVKLTVEVLFEDSEMIAQTIYAGEHHCEKMRSNEPYVVKHTSQ